MTEESELYLKIKKLADNQKISMLTLNDKAKLGTNAIYRWRTQTPGTDKIKKVADVLGVSVDYLLGNTDEMMPNKKDSSDSESNDVKEFFKKHEVFSYDGKPISEKDLATIKFILENGYEDK